jgi:septum formation protein
MLILASGSQTRRKMLDDAGVPFRQHAVRIDEAAIKEALQAEGAGPRDIADTLAEYKARRVSADPGALVLGCDQVLALKSEVISKADSRAAAAETLARLAGKTHHLYAAAVIYADGAPVWRHVGIARMTMHPLTPAQIETYLEEAWPEVAGSVGSYQAEGLGARLFSRIEGDWFSVLGLPLLDVLSYLRLRGWPSS